MYCFNEIKRHRKPMFAVPIHHQKVKESNAAVDKLVLYNINDCFNETSHTIFFWLSINIILVDCYYLINIVIDVYDVDTVYYIFCMYKMYKRWLVQKPNYTFIYNNRVGFGCFVARDIGSRRRFSFNNKWRFVDFDKIMIVDSWLKIRTVVLMD